MPDRDDDDAERGAPAVRLGATGGAEVGHAGQPGAGHGAGQPGGHPGAGHAAQPTAQPGAGHTAGQPDGAQALSQPGGGHAAGQPGSAHALGQPGGGHAAGQPGGGHTAAQPSSAQPLAQPEAGQAGQPAAQTGTGYPAQPGAGPSGATSSISVKGILIAAAAIVAVIIAVVAAFFVLRPNPPQQTAAQQSPTTTNNPTPGTAPGAATADGPLFRGTYTWQGSDGNGTITVTSDCPACDVTVAGPFSTRTFNWTGTGWTSAGDCPSTYSPIVVVDGIVVEYSTQALVCYGTSIGTTTGRRTGD
jgi:hypothetical protein